MWKNENLGIPRMANTLLQNGVSMPVLGLGTSHSGGYSHAAVTSALENGYRLIDTAKRYGCEEKIHKAIVESGIPREDLFITTKLWPTDYGSNTVETFKGSLRRLGLNYIDLYMLHWPLCPSSCKDPKQMIQETWRHLEQLYDEELVRAIGVSNFEISHLEDLIESSSIIPHVNQIEFHPYFYQPELLEYCSEMGIQIEGYCPLAKGTILNEPPIVAVAKSAGKTPAQVLIRWAIQRGVVTIPKSTKVNRVIENSQVFDFSLTKTEMELLDSLQNGRRVSDVSSIQSKIDNIQPDGYKLIATS